jgi:peptidyl-prolyl cis-trans isomerase SurA
MKSLLTIGLGLSLCCGAAQAQNLVANGIVVIVNDAVITLKDVDQSIARDIDLLRVQYAGKPSELAAKITQIQKERIEELVSHQLILQEFKSAGYSLPESMIDDIVESRIKDNFGDRVTLTKTLQSQGTTFEGFRRRIRDQVIVDAMVRHKNGTSEPIISPTKIENFYEANKDKFEVEHQVKLRMIMMNKPANNAEATVRLAHEIHEKLKAGASFAEMAGVYSEDSHRSQGGDWGWIERSVLRSNLAEVAFNLKPGQFCDVIDTPETCYLLLAEDVRPAHVRPLSEVRDEIERTLIARERERLYRQWIERLKTKSFVRYFPF